MTNRSPDKDFNPERPDLTARLQRLLHLLKFILVPAALTWVAGIPFYVREKADYTSPSASAFWNYASLPFYAVMFITPLIFLFHLLWMISPRRRRLAKRVLVACLAIFGVMVSWFDRVDHARTAAFVACAKNIEPLITAIKAYEKKHGEPPPELKALIPDFLAKIPTTGIKAFSPYRYLSGEAARKSFDGNPWALTIDMPDGLMDFSYFLYLPNQKYPAHGYGGPIERIGDWGYVRD